ncbi:MAG: hypothetical protein M3Y46_12565 [Actinomycetota bacterium]|nr:hypothetical protein [Actinomycetota bacterium]
MGTADEDRLERRRDELRRIVFGTPGGAPVDAEEELVAIERELAARRAREGVDHDERRATAPGAGAELDATAASDRRALDDHDAAAVDAAANPELVARRSSRSRGHRRGIAVAGVLVLVGAGAVLSSGVREALSPARGLEIFEREPSARELVLVDRVATTASVSADDAVSLRSLGRVFGYDFWAYRNPHQVCLLSQRPFFFDWVRTCASHRGFDRFGLSRRISGGDIRSIARPQRIQPDDVVVVSWGPDSIDIEWYVERPDPARGLEGPVPMTYGEWSSSRLAVRPDGS